MRPYVVVTAPASGADVNFFNLSIKNIGARPARNIRVTLDPPPRRARDVHGQALADTKMLKEPISLLAPGQELSTFYDSQLERNGRDDLPTSHQVDLTYEDLSGISYTERMQIDLEALMGSEHIGVRTVSDVAKELETIRKQLAKTSLLSTTASMEVAAVVESRPERIDRVAHEDYLNDIESVKTIRLVNPTDTRTIARYEQRIAEYEASHAARRARSRRRPQLNGGYRKEGFPVRRRARYE